MQDHRGNDKTDDIDDVFRNINHEGEHRRDYEPGSFDDDPEVLDEAISAQYPEDVDDFMLAGDEDELRGADDWPLAEDEPEEARGNWSEQDEEDEEEYEEEYEDELEEPEEDPPHWLETRQAPEEGVSWPIGLIAVVVIALVLLAAGGYGVMQQRAATQEELRDLRARLANAVTPEQAAEERESLRALREENQLLRVERESLQRDNERLNATVTGLEGQLQAQVEATRQVTEKTTRDRAARDRATRDRATPEKAAVTSQPSAPTTSAAAGSGDWFVNFSSYYQSATAETWRDKLNPGVGQVVITTGSSDRGTLYRVRVVGLASRAQAESVARSLEQQYNLDRLWVGREPAR